MKSPLSQTGFYDSAAKRILFLLVLFLFFSSDLFCQTANFQIPGLKTAFGIILGFFTSMYMKAILTIALGILAAGLIVNRGEPGVIKKFIPWIAACALLLSLSAITGIMFTPDGQKIPDIAPTSWN